MNSHSGNRCFSLFSHQGGRKFFFVLNFVLLLKNPFKLQCFSWSGQKLFFWQSCNFVTLVWPHCRRTHIFTSVNHNVKLGRTSERENHSITIIKQPSSSFFTHSPLFFPPVLTDWLSQLSIDELPAFFRPSNEWATFFQVEDDYSRRRRKWRGENEEKVKVNFLVNELRRVIRPRKAKVNEFLLYLLAQPSSIYIYMYTIYSDNFSEAWKKRRRSEEDLQSS